MRLGGVRRDRKNITRWARRIPNPQFGIGKTNARSEVIRQSLRAPRTSSTVIYFAGHVENCNNELYYLSADLGYIKPRGISFSEIRELLLEDSTPRPLLLITDFCECENILRLPYVLFDDGVNAHWEEIKACDPLSWATEKQMLHFAATDVGQAAQEFKSTGGLFTNKFCKIPPHEEMTLLERSRDIQMRMDRFLKEYAAMKGSEVPIVQQHRIYSSHKLDLTDVHVLHPFYP